MYLMNPIVLVSIFLLSLFIFVATKTKISSSSGQSLNLPPSPPRLPLIGNLHQLGTFPHRSLGALSDKHGPLMLLHLGHTKTLVVSSAEAVKEIVKSYDIAFSDRPQITAAKILLYGFDDVAFSPYGEYWRKARKICVHELLSAKRVRQFQHVMEEEVGLLLGRARKASSDGKSINLSGMLISTPNNVVSRCILGRSFEDDSFGELTRNLMESLAAFCIEDYFPSLRWVDEVRGFLPGLRSLAGEFDRFYNKVIGEHKVDHGSDRDGDFVDILLQLQKDDLLNFTPQKLKALIADMFVGGSVTTSTATEWLMAELIRNPRVMKKAQEEIRRVVGKKRKIDAEDFNMMNYLKCVVKETLRLHPPLPLLVARETSSRTEIGGFSIPARATVLINAWAIQRSPDLWDRPEEFVPERFENSTLDFLGQDFQFIPFGTGRRGCPGLMFGIANIEFAIASLLYWFDWKLTCGMLPEELDMSEARGLVVSKNVPLNVSPIVYDP